MKVEAPILPTKQAVPTVASLYARVSSSKQEVEETIDSQLAEVKSKIQEDGCILPPGNIFIDEGWSGEMLKRPALDKMRDCIKTRTFQVLYVYDRGRLSRKFAHQELIIEELQSADIKFVTLHDLPADNDEQRMFQAMQGVFHEYERIKIAERFRRGKLYKAESGVMVGGDAPYGYTRISKTENKPAYCIINQEEARVVRMIFEWFGRERISIREIIRRLYKLGIMPRKRKRKFWSKSPIVRLLRLQTYIDGLVYYNKTESVPPKNPINKDSYKKIKKSSRRMRPKKEWFEFKVPVVLKDKKLFWDVQKILDSNKKFAVRHRTGAYHYLLTGKIICRCGAPRCGDGGSKQGHHYYRCSDRIKKFPLKSDCSLRGINAEILDKTFWAGLAAFLTNPKFLRDAARDFLSSKSLGNVEAKIQCQQLSNQIQAIDKEESRYIKAYGTGDLEFKQYKKFIKDCKSRKLALQKQLTNYQKQLKTKTDSILTKELCNEAKKVLQSINLKNKIKVVQEIIDKIIINSETRADIWIHVPVKLGYEPINWNCGSS